MSKKHESRLAMYNSVLKLTSAHPEIGAEVPSYKEALNNLETISFSIDRMLKDWFAPQTGQTKVKNALREATIDSVYPIMAQLSSLAAATNDLDLKEKTGLPISALRMMREGQFLQVAAKVQEDALARAEALKAYGVDQAALDNMTAKIEALRLLTGTRGKNAALRSGQLKKLDDLYAAANEILSEHLDKQVELYRNTSPDFYHEYGVARIVRTTVRHRPAEPQVPPDGSSPTATTAIAAPTPIPATTPVPTVSATNQSR